MAPGSLRICPLGYEDVKSLIAEKRAYDGICPSTGKPLNRHRGSEEINFMGN